MVHVIYAVNLTYPWHEPLHITKYSKAVIYAINLSVTQTITHTCMAGKAVIYALPYPWHELLHALVWKHSDQHEPYKEYG